MSWFVASVLTENLTDVDNEISLRTGQAIEPILNPLMRRFHQITQLHSSLFQSPVFLSNSHLRRILFEIGELCNHGVFVLLTAYQQHHPSTPQ